MRVRALDVSSAHVDGLVVPVRACTLAVRTDPDGRRGWDASGWLRSAPGPDLAGLAAGGPVQVSLDTPEVTLDGAAHVSFVRLAGGGGVTVALAGVGRLDPWPG